MRFVVKHRRTIHFGHQRAELVCQRRAAFLHPLKTPEIGPHGAVPALQRILKTILILQRQGEICGKKHQTGNNVSHANNKTKRVFNPNLQRVKALVNGAALRAFGYAPVVCGLAWSKKPSLRELLSAFTEDPV